MLICDVNGVLVDSTAAVVAAFAATAAHYAFAFGPAQFQIVKGLTLLDAFAALDSGGDHARQRDFHLACVRERVDEIEVCPGVRETLVAVRAMGLRVGAATSIGEIAEACLVRTGVYPLIDGLVTQEEVARPKPHPDAILRVLGLLTGSRHHATREAAGDIAVYVGDAIGDVEAGKAAGVRTAGVTYGVSSEGEMRAAEPDYVVRAFDELLPVLADLQRTGSRRRVHHTELIRIP